MSHQSKQNLKSPKVSCLIRLDMKASAIKDFNIYVLQSLAGEWKDLGTTVGTLSSDSSNIVSLIKKNYEVSDCFFGHF